jgi:hydroxymethylpyrimidine pyrophosphatase-like HAD family hydrolase
MKIYNLFFIILFYQCCIFAEIRTIFSLKEAQEVLEKLDENALVVFDIDETLILVKDKIRRKHPEKIIADFNLTHFDTLIEDVERKECLDSIILKTAQQKLIEPESVDIIKKLQSKNIKVIALTHMHAGKYSSIYSMHSLSL